MRDPSESLCRTIVHLKLIWDYVLRSHYAEGKRSIFSKPRPHGHSGLDSTKTLYDRE